MNDAKARLEAALREHAPHLGAGPDRARLAAAADREGLLDVAWCRVDSPVGPLIVAGTRLGVLAISYQDPDRALERVAATVSPRILEHPARLDPVRRQLDEYFDGRRRRFELDLDRRLVSGFRAEVLSELETVSYGRTVSYGELAARVGNPRAVRAVGSAMATNPLPVVVPCHRVLRSGGKLGGYAGGLDAKRWLLDHEGTPLPPA